MKTTTTRRRRKAAPVVTHKDHRAILARRLATLADLHLQQGFHRAAEVLATRAAALREGRA